VRDRRKPAIVLTVRSNGPRIVYRHAFIKAARSGSSVRPCGPNNGGVPAAGQDPL
jgi:hypothetical protein